MSFPPSTQVVPTLSPFQVWFNGVTIGGNTNSINLKEIDGLDLSAAWRTGDAGRARDHGEWAGLDLLPGRDITITCDVGPLSYGGNSYTYGSASLNYGSAITYGGALVGLPLPLSSLSSMMTSGGMVESPLYVCMPWGPTYACMARARAHSSKADVAFSGAQFLQNVDLAFHATDPRIYTTPTTVTSGTGNSGTFTITNYGDIDCRPIVTFTGTSGGTLGGLTITNNSVAGAPTMTLANGLSNGQQMVLDFDAQTILLSDSPSYNNLVSGSTWWSIIPGSNSISYSCGGNTVSVAIQWASAYTAVL